jgi:hypothetical protein
MLQGTQVLASICVIISAFLAAVLLYIAVVIRCSTQQHSARYCFQLTSTCAIFPVLLDALVLCYLRPSYA